MGVREEDSLSFLMAFLFYDQTKGKLQASLSMISNGVCEVLKVKSGGYMYYYLKQLSYFFVTALLILVSFAPMQVTAAPSHDNDVAARFYVRYGGGHPYGGHYNRGYYNYNYYPYGGYRYNYDRPYYNSYYYNDYYDPHWYGGGYNNGLYLRFNVR